MVGQPKNAEAFKSLIVSYKNNAPIRLQDIAIVEDSVLDNRSMGIVNGKRSIVLAIQRQPAASTTLQYNNNQQPAPPSNTTTTSSQHYQANSTVASYILFHPG